MQAKLQIWLYCQIENESDSDDDLLSSDNDVGNRSDDDSHGRDISDEKSSDLDVQIKSLAVQRPCTMQARTKNNYMWDPATRQSQLHNFSGNSRPTPLASVVDVENCLEYFQLTITDDILDIVAEETNCYADQFFLSNTGTLPTHSRANNCKPLTLLSLKIFLGLTLTTGLLDKRGHLSDYWSKNPILFTHFLVRQCREIGTKTY